MAFGHKSGLVVKFLAHINIENHMTRDFLTSNKILGIVVAFINCIFDIGHILVYWISPKMVTVMIIGLKCLRDRLGYPDTNIFRLLPVFGLEVLDDCLAFLQCEGCPQ